jgi:hypothetical protein
MQADARIHSALFLKVGMGDASSARDAEAFIERMQRARPGAIRDALAAMLTEQARLREPNAGEVWVDNSLQISVDGPPGSRQVSIRTGRYVIGGSDMRAIADLVTQRGGLAQHERVLLNPGVRTPSFQSTVRMSLEDFARIMPDLQRHFPGQAPAVDRLPGHQDRAPRAPRPAP